MRRPAEVYPPSAFVHEEMAARGWRWKDLMERSGLHLDEIAEVIYWGYPMTAHVAAGLARAFGTSAQFWLNLDAAYRGQQEGGERC